MILIPRSKIAARAKIRTCDVDGDGDDVAQDAEDADDRLKNILQPKEVKKGPGSVAQLIETPYKTIELIN